MASTDIKHNTFRHTGGVGRFPVTQNRSLAFHEVLNKYSKPPVIKDPEFSSNWQTFQRKFTAFIFKFVMCKCSPTTWAFSQPPLTVQPVIFPHTGAKTVGAG
jgi:hypothetical protein